MERMIAKCGIICTECDAYIATQNDDFEMKKKIANEWTKRYDFKFTPETINCDGCQVDTGQLCSWVTNVCKIRTCAIEKCVTTCAECDDYGCEILVASFLDVPEAKVLLDELRGDK